MTMKKFAHSAQQHLQISTGYSFKRTHIYELLASSFGFKSYAALCADHIFTKQPERTGQIFMEQPERTAIPVENQLMLKQRITDLGYDVKPVDVALSTFISFISEQRLNIVALEDLIDELERDWPSQYHDDEFSPILLEGLEAKAQQGDYRAHYLLTLIYNPDNEYENQTGVDYWWSQEQQGRKLTGMQKEWADGYARKLEIAEKYAFHLDAYLDAAKIHGHIGDPAIAAELAAIQGREEDIKHWLIVAAESGDTEAMRRLIDEFESDNLQRCWMWVYLSEMLGDDLTASNLHAYHDGGMHAGQLYDDDVGGPLYVAGDEGVELEPLDEAGDREAKKLADTIFRSIQQSVA